MASLFGAQPGAICFHELNPSCAIHQINPQPLLNTINEFQRIIDGGDKRLLTVDYSRQRSVDTYAELVALPANPSIIGDIAYYYLTYVDEILAVNPAVKFVCIKRDKQSTVDSWMEKTAIKRWPSLWLADRIKSLLTRTPFHTAMNHWQEHDGQKWELSPVWDHTFPNFEAAGKRKAVEKYWDWYYLEAAEVEQKYPDNFKIFDISMLSHPEGQRAILMFCGLEDEEMVLRDKVHLHKSK
tara:strand:- start:2312 stop:3031 length:720 start_codon:yes stop_codon:yes gene_type:complete